MVGPAGDLVAGELGGEAAQQDGVEVGRPGAEAGVDGEWPADGGDELAGGEVVDADERDVRVAFGGATGGVEAPLEGVRVEPSRSRVAAVIQDLRVRGGWAGVSRPVLWLAGTARSVSCSTIGMVVGSA